jgi:hypothetical protein
MLTIKTMESVVVSRARIPVDTLYPDRNTMIQVSDTASGLRHFKFKCPRLPSSFLKKYARVLYRLEEELLMAHELYELQAQLARIPLEDFATLSRGSRWQARVTGSYCLGLKRTCRKKRLPSLLTGKLLLALIKFCANSIARTRAADALIGGQDSGFSRRILQWRIITRSRGKLQDRLNGRILKSGGPPRKSSAL